jgi:hypothetical protein
MIDFELDGPNTSRLLFDIYSPSHFVHGYLFFVIISHFLTRDPKLILFIGTAMELVWEWFENTPYIIKKYRAKPEFANYLGDSWLNVMGDVSVSMLGLLVSIYDSQLALLVSIFLEVITIPHKANFLYLSLGSLLTK